MGHRIDQKRGTLRAALLLACAIALFLLAFAPGALAAPNHPRTEALDISGLNHACGAAVDSHGDVYASSAGESKVKVFDEAHTLLKEIPNAHEPCGLAVDTNGNLYVSEKETGEVVRYHPSEYPPTASTSYAEATVDDSGNAKGVSVDPIEDSLYVAEGNRIAMFNSEGTPGINERQRVRAPESSGKYKLCFEAQCTPELEFNASHAEVEAALSALSTIGGLANVSVTQDQEEPANPSDHLVTFKGVFAGVDVEQLTCVSGCFIATTSQGWDGHIDEGVLSGASGVASYTYGGTHYVSAAEPGEGDIEVLAGHNIRDLEPRATIDGSDSDTFKGDKTPAGELGLAAGAYLGADPATGHLFAYDHTNKVVNEFEATGHYFTQIASPEFADAEPTQIAVDRSGSANDGTVYVTAGAITGAKALAFGPAVVPSRRELKAPHQPHSFAFTSACGTVVDSHGDLYVAGESIIRVFDPAGNEIKVGPEGKGIPDSKHPCALAVDSEGNLYAVDMNVLASGGDETVELLSPSAYPPTAGTTYTGAPTPIDGDEPKGIAVVPADDAAAKDHLFVVGPTGVREYDSAAHSSTLLNGEFCGLKDPNQSGIDVYGASGDVYVAQSHEIVVCDSAGTRVASINGSGSPEGTFGLFEGAQVAVDQSSGHVLIGEMHTRGVVEEFEASGAYVGSFSSSSFSKGIFGGSDLAIDSSGGPNQGDLYVAYNSNLTAFGPLSYGEPPQVATGIASGVSGTAATLNGTADPNEFEVETCRFEYLEDAEYQANLEAREAEGHEEPAAEGYGFEGAEEADCEEPNAVEIGAGTEPVAVHADLTGLEAEGRYRFRLLAGNKYGQSEGQAGVFGPPLIAPRSAQPVLYREAILRGNLDPSGLQTEYHFEYMTKAEYVEAGESFAGAKSAPPKTLSATAGTTDISTYLGGLQEATPYSFRLVAENEAATEFGPAQTLTTLAPRPNPPCANATLRLENNSTNLPDCRAYELVTPADTRGAPPHAPSGLFNIWPVTPSGPLTGESLAFAIPGSLPGTEGNGTSQHFRATRGAEGWASDPYSPTYADVGGFALFPQGLSLDQRFSFWTVFESGGSLSAGTYLRTPAGSPAPSSHCAVPAEPEGRFELIGCGSLSDDPGAEGDYISPGGSHVIFASETTSAHTAVQLEPGAPASPLSAVYDRSPGGLTYVVSLLPGDVTPSASATYLGASPDGTAVVFSAGGKMYVRIDDAETVKVSDGPASFAGISDDGKHIFYAATGNAKAAAPLEVCDITEGACTASEIASDAKFVNVAAGGSRAYFTSEEPVGGEGSVGQPNLFAWDEGATRLIANLSPEDVKENGGIFFPGTSEGEGVALDAWAAKCVVSGAALSNGAGRVTCPSRTSPDGRYLVFQSHADLAPPYEGLGHSEVYRYDASDGSLLCVSCDPSGIPATAGADLQSYNTGAGTLVTTLIPGVSKDGSEIFFQTETALLPEDANSVTDVYEWESDGIGGCEREEGCLSLISSGQGDEPSYIYAMTPDGHDVFFTTTQKLVGSDLVGSPSIYDARVDGGFPAEVEQEACHGDACQGEGSAPPSRPSVHSDAPGSGNVEEPATPKPGSCPRGRRAVKRGGKTHCVKPHHHKRHKRAKAKRRAGR